jgi:vacuolar-type H+-ATPase subunit E/Vma4
VSLQDVEKKVLAAAEAEARQILAQAEAEAQAERKRRGDALREEQQRATQAAKAEADAALERELSTRRAEHVMTILQAKNAILDAIFEGTRDCMLRSQGADYGSWLARQVRRAVAGGSGVLHCNERDRVTVEAVLRETGTDRVVMAPENAPIQGGVLLVGPSFDLDLTLEAILADLREEHLVAFAGRLFGDVPAMGDLGSVLGD